MTIEGLIRNSYPEQHRAFRGAPYNYKVISTTGLEEEFKVIVCLQVGKQRPLFQYVFNITTEHGRTLAVGLDATQSGRAEDVLLWSCR